MKNPFASNLAFCSYCNSFSFLFQQSFDLTSFHSSHGSADLCYVLSGHSWLTRVSTSARCSWSDFTKYTPSELPWLKWDLGTGLQSFSSTYCALHLTGSKSANLACIKSKQQCLRPTDISIISQLCIGNPQSKRHPECVLKQVYSTDWHDSGKSGEALCAFLLLFCFSLFSSISISYCFIS